MADYTEIRQLFNDSELRNRSVVAVIVAAAAIVDGIATETTERIAWAQRALSGPEREGERALMIVLANNVSLTVAQIRAAGDAALQTEVDKVVDLLAKGLSPGA